MGRLQIIVNEGHVSKRKLVNICCIENLWFSMITYDYLFSSREKVSKGQMVIENNPKNSKRRRPLEFYKVSYMKQGYRNYEICV